MLAVGLRELKNRLAEYIRRVRAGESVLITDRGAVVAELRPPSTLTEMVHPELARLVSRGYATIGAGNDPSVYPPLSALVADGTAAELIDADREDP